MYIRNTYVETDTGFLFEDISTIRRPVVYKDMFERNVYRDPDDRTSNFFNLDVRMEKSKESWYRRRYKKIQNLVPELGGLLKIMTTLGFILCFPIAILDLKKNMVNSHYQFENDIDEDPQKQIENPNGAGMESS